MVPRGVIQGLHPRRALLFASNGTEMFTIINDSMVAAFAYDVNTNEWHLGRAAPCPLSPYHDSWSLQWIGNCIVLVNSDHLGNDFRVHFIDKQTLRVTETVVAPEGMWQHVEATSRSCFWLTDSGATIWHWDGVDGHALACLPVEREIMRADLQSLFVIGYCGDRVYVFHKSAPATVAAVVQIPRNGFDYIETIDVLDHFCAVVTTTEAKITIDTATRTHTTEPFDADGHMHSVATEPGANAYYAVIGYPPTVHACGA